MKKTVLFGVLAMASGLAVASTVPTGTVAVTPWMPDEILNTTNTTNPPSHYDPAWYELVTGASAALTTFSLIDTEPDDKNVTYQLYTDTDSDVNEFDLGSLLGTWSLSDSTLGSFSFLLGAGSQYVLKIATDGARSSATRVSAVPLPGAALLFGSALLGAGVIGRKKLVAKAV